MVIHWCYLIPMDPSNCQWCVQKERPNADRYPCNDRYNDHSPCGETWPEILINGDSSPSIDKVLKFRIFTVNSTPQKRPIGGLFLKILKSTLGLTKVCQSSENFLKNPFPLGKVTFKRLNQSPTVTKKHWMLFDREAFSLKIWVNFQQKVSTCFLSKTQ